MNVKCVCVLLGMLCIGCMAQAESQLGIANSHSKNDGWARVDAIEQDGTQELTLFGADNAVHVVILKSSSSPMTTASHVVALNMNGSAVIDVVTGRYIVAWCKICPKGHPDILMLTDLVGYGSDYMKCKDTFMVVNAKGHLEVVLKDEGAEHFEDWQWTTILTEWKSQDTAVVIRRTAKTFETSLTSGRRVVSRGDRVTVTSIEELK